MFSKGPLLPAIAASMALPGLFKPQILNGRVLVDGGMVNPVPFDLVMPICDISLAVDVSGVPRKREGTETPSFLDTVFSAIQIMQQSVVKEKLRNRQPELLVRPELDNIRVLDFHKFDQIYRLASLAKERARKALESQLSEV